MGQDGREGLDPTQPVVRHEIVQERAKLELPVLGSRELLEPLAVSGELSSFCRWNRLASFRSGVPVDISCCVPRTQMSEYQFACPSTRTREPSPRFPTVTFSITRGRAAAPRLHPDFTQKVAPKKSQRGPKAVTRKTLIYDPLFVARWLWCHVGKGS